MSIISRLTTWTIGQVLKAADLNGEFNNITNLFNNLDAATTSWTNVKTGILTTTGTTTLKGTATNDSAAAGNVGEILSASRIRSTATALTSTVVVNVTSLSITAGQWLLIGRVGHDFDTTTSVTALIHSLSTTSATHSGADTIGVPDATGQIRGQWDQAAAVNGNAARTFPPLITPLQLASTTTYYLTSSVTFTVSTTSVYGSMTAIRIR